MDEYNKAYTDGEYTDDEYNDDDNDDDVDEYSNEAVRLMAGMMQTYLKMTCDTTSPVSIMDEYRPLVSLMYEIWESTVPYGKMFWKLCGDHDKQLFNFGMWRKMLEDMAPFTLKISGSVMQTLDASQKSCGDVDYMFVEKHILVKTRESCISLDDEDKVLFLLEPAHGSPPGFYSLKLLSKHSKVIKHFCGAGFNPNLVNNSYLSSQEYMNVRQPFFSDVLCLKISTSESCPAFQSVNAVGGNMIEHDYVPCLLCDGWPEDVKQEYKNRRRPSGWPNQDLIQETLNQSTYVVATGYKGSKTQHMEWRFSCSAAETTLAQSLPPICHAVYNLAKGCFKDFVMEFHQRHGIKPIRTVTSYQFKNFFLSNCEKISPETFTKNGIVSNAVELIEQFGHVLIKGNLSHYFFPKQDMLELLSSEYKDAVGRFLTCHPTVLQKFVCYFVDVQFGTWQIDCLWKDTSRSDLDLITQHGLTEGVQDIYRKWSKLKTTAQHQFNDWCHIRYNTEVISFILGKYKTDGCLPKWSVLSSCELADIEINSRINDLCYAIPMYDNKEATPAEIGDFLTNVIPSKIDHTELFCCSIALTWLYCKENKDKRRLISNKIQLVINRTLQNPEEFFYVGYMQCSNDIEFAGMIVNHSFEMLHRDTCLLIPFCVAKDFEKTFLPLVHPLLWLQYLAIISSAHKVDNRGQDNITKGVVRFLKLHDIFSDLRQAYVDYFAQSSESHMQKKLVSCNPYLMKLRDYVSVFYCVRMFSLSQQNIN